MTKFTEGGLIKKGEHEKVPIMVFPGVCYVSRDVFEQYETATLKQLLGTDKIVVTDDPIDEEDGLLVNGKKHECEVTTMQWGPIFWEGGMRIASLIDTKAFATIQHDSRIVDLFVLGGAGDVGVLKERYVNLSFNEFKQLIKNLYE